ALDVAAGDRVVLPHNGAVVTGAGETATGVNVDEIVVRRVYFRIGVEVDAGLGALAAGDVEVGQADRLGLFAPRVHDLHAVLGEAAQRRPIQHQTGNVKLNRDQRVQLGLAVDRAVERDAFAVEPEVPGPREKQQRLRRILDRRRPHHLGARLGLNRHGGGAGRGGWQRFPLLGLARVNDNSPLWRCSGLPEWGATALAPG